MTVVLPLSVFFLSSYLIICHTSLSPLLMALCLLVIGCCIYAFTIHQERKDHTHRDRPLPSNANSNISPLQLCLVRKSIRVYDEQSPLTPEELTLLTDLIHDNNTITGPFGTKVHVELVHTKEAAHHKLGTYGFIRGATSFFCVFTDKDTNITDVGIVFQRIVLRCTRLGLGTCWMAGTFSSADFLKVAKYDKNEKLSFVSPVGHPLDKETLSSRLNPLFDGSNLRKPFNTFFCKGTDPSIEEAHFTKEEQESPLGQILEATRWAPSAMNWQPARACVVPRSYGATSHSYFSLDDPVAVHFFYAPHTMFPVDVGIAMANFATAAEHFNRKGHFVELKKDRDVVPYPVIASKSGKSVETWTYVGTWIED